MKKTDFLEAKLNRYNGVSAIKLKINGDTVNGINLYTEDNHLVACGKISQVELILDALITLKNLEEHEEKNDMKNLILIQSKAENALSGKLVPTLGNEEAILVLQAMKIIVQKWDFDAEEVVKKALHHCPKGVIKHIVVNRVYGEIHIAFVLATPEIPVPSDLETEEGVFAYVYNMDYDYDSELGYIFFKKDQDGIYRRRG